MPTSFDEEILRSLRRITRAIDLHSRKLASTYGLTGPQLVCLRVLADLEAPTPGALARDVALSQGTVTGILDRLVARQLITRERDTRDRRQVRIGLTEAGRSMVDAAPSPLQETFRDALAALPEEEQRRIRDTLAQVVRMMGWADIEAAPLLDTSEDLADGGPDTSCEEVGDLDSNHDPDATP